MTPFLNPNMNKLSSYSLMFCNVKTIKTNVSFAIINNSLLFCIPFPINIYVPSTDIAIDAVNGQLAINNTLKHFAVSRYTMLKSVMVVLIVDLPMDPNTSTGKCAFCGPSGKMGRGQGDLLLFTQRKFQTNSGALNREALSLSPHS